MATVMQVMNISLVNIALPHMQAELGATPDEISWALTSYLIATAIFIPTTGYLADRFGSRQVLIWGSIVFTAISVLCGLSTHLGEFVFLRLLQGIAGAPLVPVAQLVMIENHPPEEQTRALAYWSTASMVVPVFGPTVGAWLTDALNWRWCFHLCVPLGVLTVLLTAHAVPQARTRRRPMDWTGFGFMMLAVGGLQYALDRGNRVDWFDAGEIRIAVLLAAAGFAAFVLHSRRSRVRPIFSLTLLRDRNLLAASVMMSVFAITLFGTMVVQPMLLVTLLHYPPMTAGVLMAVRAICTAATMLAAPNIMAGLGIRGTLITGTALVSAGTWGMASMSLDVDAVGFALPTVLHGLGLGMLFLPATTIAFVTLAAEQRSDASGLYNLFRSLGQSLGISLNVMLLTRMTQTSWNQLSGHVDRFNPALGAYAGQLGLRPDDPATLGVVAAELGRQATMVAMLDVFVFLTWFGLVTLPLVLLIRAETGKPAPARGG